MPKNLLEQADPDLLYGHEIVRWYLKETELAVHDEAESAKEDAAAQVLAHFIDKRRRPFGPHRST